jgi:hypothetical protein
MLRDFGTFPVAVDVYPEGYDGPAREAAPFRYRSGWLMVSEARIAMPFGTWRRPLVACISDYGEVYPPSIAARLLAMPASLPKDAEVDPPEALEEVTDALYWDFLGAMDGENLRYLQEAEERTDKKLRDFEERSFLVDKKLAVHMRELRQERRRVKTSTERSVQIDAILARLEGIGDQFAVDMRKYMSTLRAENEELEKTILSALTDHGEVEQLYTIYWTVRRNRRGALRFPVFQEEPYSAEAWRNREEPGISFGNGRGIGSDPIRRSTRMSAGKRFPPSVVRPLSRR